MGSPKALLEYHGETFLDRWIGLFAPHCAAVIVVLGAHAGEIRAGIRRRSQARLVENADYQAGQLSSMQCGLQAVPAEADDILFTLVDHPAVTAETVARLAAGPSTPLRIPRYDGRRGHPIRFSRALAAEFLALPVSAAARDVVARHASDAAYLEVEDAGILADIDDAEAYARLSAGSRV